MKKEDFKKADGTDGTKYRFEKGDKATIVYDKIYVSPERLGVNKTTGQAFKTQDYILGVKTEKEGEIKVNLSKTQAEKLKNREDLQGKNIEAYEYENKYGKQIGIKVV